MVFKEKYSKFFEKIGRSKFMVLSTSKDDFVTSRMVSIIVIDGKFYFQNNYSTNRCRTPRMEDALTSRYAA